MGSSALFGAKKFRIFQNLWSVRTEKRNEPVRTRGGGQFFAILFGRSITVRLSFVHIRNILLHYLFCLHCPCNHVIGNSLNPTKQLTNLTKLQAIV